MRNLIPIIAAAATLQDDQGMSYWVASLIVGALSAVVGAAVGGVIAFPVGVERGKRQTLHDEQVRVVDETRRQLLDFVPTLRLAAASQDEDWRRDLKSKMDVIRISFRDKRVWLPRRRADRLEGIIDEYMKEADKVLRQPPAADPVRIGHADEIPYSADEWANTEGKRLADALENEARKLFGTD